MIFSGFITLVEETGHNKDCTLQVQNGESFIFFNPGSFFLHENGSNKPYRHVFSGARLRAQIANRALSRGCAHNASKSSFFNHQSKYHTTSAVAGLGSLHIKLSINNLVSVPEVY